jgi:hypothetical protein
MFERMDYIRISYDEMISGRIHVHLFWFELNQK